MKPTLYTLIFKNNYCGEYPDYDVYERHQCQEKGCIKTDEKYLTVCLPGNIEKFVKEFQDQLV